MEREIVMDQNAHNAEIMRNLNSFRKDKIHCDFTIKVGSEEMPVHKNVLSAGSDYFKAMLAHDTKESQSGIVIMKECNPVCVTKCVDFIYTGTGSVSDENREELMQVAHMMQLQRLCDGIALFLEKDLNSESFFSTKRIAKMFDCQNLQNHCNEFALENFCSVALSEDFKHLGMEDISYMIKAEKAKASVADKCKALIIWTQHEPDDRVKFFKEIFITLNLSKLRFEYVKYLIENEPLVYNSLSCWRPLVLKTSIKSSVEAKDYTLTGMKENNVIAVFDKESKAIQGFDPQQEKWIEINKISQGLETKSFIPVAHENDIYLIMDDRTNHILRNYSSKSTAVWNKLPDRQKSGRHLAVMHEGSLYAFEDGSTNGQMVQVLQPSTNLWSDSVKKPIPASECAVVSTSSYIFCLGGYDGKTSLTHNFRFNPKASEWSEMPQMISKRASAAAVEFYDKLFVMGGTPAPGYWNTVECFDLTTETWTAIANMNYARYVFSACAFGGKIYVCGGARSNDAIEEYDPDQNTWKIIGPLTGKQLVPRAVVALRV